MIYLPPGDAADKANQSALDLITAWIAQARAAGNSADWTMGLVFRQAIESIIRINNTEESLDTYRLSPWPDDLLGRAAATFYYVLTLAAYAYQYSGFIADREGTVKHSPDSIETWSQQHLRQEALRRLAPLWHHRAELAEHRQEKLAEIIPLDEYLSPPCITLRDTVSYLLVRVLAQTEWWTAEELSAAEGIDLLRPHAASVAAHPGAHPLERIAAVLDDLARWHEAQGHQEAAIVAWLHKLERAHALQRGPGVRRRLRGALAKRVETLGGKAGETRAAATLVAFTLAAEQPGRALEIARACQARADDPGAGACSHFVGLIAMPELALSTEQTAALDRRKLVLVTRNLPRVYLRAYPITRRQLTGGTDTASLLTAEAIERIVHRKKPAATWVAAPAPSDALTPQSTPITPPLTGPGAFLVLASAREDFAQEDNLIKGAVVVLSDLVLVRQPEPDRVTVTAVSASTGQPLPGVKITCHQRFWTMPAAVIATAITDAEGRARFERLARGRFHFFSGQKGREWTTHVDAPFFRRGDLRGDLVFLLTDRQRYRPGQTLRFKLFALQLPGEGRAAASLTNRDLTLHLEDAEGSILTSSQLTTNSWGTASDQIQLPADLPAALYLRTSFNSTRTQVALDRPAERPRGEAPSPAGAGQRDLTMTLARPLARPGDKAEVVVGSAPTPQPVFFSLYHRGALVEHRRLSVVDGATRLKLPITTAHQGGLGLVAWTVRDGCLISAAATLAVPRTEKQLTLALTPSRPQLKPGRKARVTVTAKRAATSAPAPNVELMVTLVRSDGRSCPGGPFGPGDLLDHLGLAPLPAASRGALGGIQVRTKGFSRPEPLGRLAHLAELAGVKPKEIAHDYTTGLQYDLGGFRPKQPFSFLFRGPSLQETVQPQWLEGVSAAGCGGAAEPGHFAAHVVTDEDGAAQIELSAPTAGRWVLRILATTDDLSAGALSTPLEVAR